MPQSLRSRAAWSAALLLLTPHAAFTQLPPRLVGLVTGTPSGRADAGLIECEPDGRGHAHLAMVGDVVCGATLTHIQADGVWLRGQTGTLMRLELATVPHSVSPGVNSLVFPEPPSIAPSITAADAGIVRITMTPAMLEAYLADVPGLLRAGIAAPHERTTESGSRVVDGFAVTAVTPGGLLDQVGIVAGDVIADVNGAPLQNLAALPRLIADLKTARHATIGVRRNSDRVLLVVDIK